MMEASPVPSGPRRRLSTVTSPAGSPKVTPKRKTAPLYIQLSSELLLAPKKKNATMTRRGLLRAQICKDLFGTKTQLRR